MFTKELKRNVIFPCLEKADGIPFAPRIHRTTYHLKVKHHTKTKYPRGD